MERNHRDLARSVQSRFSQALRGHRGHVRREETVIIEMILELADENAALAQRLVGLPWIFDDDRWFHSRPFKKVRNIALHLNREDPAAAERFMGLPWLADSENFSWGTTDARNIHLWSWEYFAINEIEQMIMYPHHTSRLEQPPDASVARRILDFPWFTDEISWAEAMTVNNISNTVVSPRFKISDADRAALLDSVLFEPSIDDYKPGAQQGAILLAKHGELERLFSYDWFQDGLTNIEMILISAAGYGADSASRGSGDNYLSYLEDQHILSDKVALPSGR